MKVHTLVSPYRLSNTYLVEIKTGKFIGIDIGSINISEISDIIKVYSGKLLGYFLTHAHCDHTVGIQKLWNMYQMPIYCSKNTALAINNPRKNFSIYSEEIDTFNYDLPFSIVEDDDIITFEDTCFKIMATPGHSPGCIVISSKLEVFTGDFVMKDYKTPLNLPNSSVIDYKNSKNKFIANFKNKLVTYYPGHGQIFSHLEEIF